MDLSKIKTIYMIGIKGVGMTMLAEFLAHDGFSISGSDTAETFMTDSVLQKAGIKVFQGFDESNLNEDADLVVYSTAYNETNNVELNKAIAKKMKVATFAQTLGEVFNGRHGVAVCGSHGKTTTTAWLGYVLAECGIKSNVMVGAQVPQFGGASLTGDSNYLVIEADEYQNKLQYFNPKMILLNNIDFDHPDFYEDEAAYEQAFIEFIFKLPKSGILIANFDDEIVKRLSKAYCHARIIGYGKSDDADYRISGIEWDGQKQYFKLQMRDDEGLSDVGEFSILLNGEHNVHNAAAVIIAAIELNADLHLIRRAVGEFTGTARRMQKMGEFNKAIIIDDYAHHPTEIKATLQALKQKYDNKKLRIVFHPHTFSRTQALIDDFAKSFSKADEVIVLDIYSSAREEKGEITGEQVAEYISQNLGPKKLVKYLGTLDEVEHYLRTTAMEGDLILLMGAGDVFRIGERLVSRPQ